jgi:nucleotide-binding universal stress UspA family protein
MAEIKTILLHVDAGWSSIRRLEIALELAGRLDARITAVFGAAWETGRTLYSASAALQLEGVTRTLANGEAKRRLQELRGLDAAQVTWCEVMGDTIAHGFLAEAAYADLLIIGQQTASPEDGGAPAGLASAVLLDSGRPVLVVPLEQASAAVAGRVLVAWNASPQAARAVAGALPLLRKAGPVHVATWSHLPPASPFGALDIGEFLRRHGVAAVVQRFDASPHVSAEIGVLAHELGADLIVMGCYGHSRAAERVFGGASRSVLASMAVPVLMAH